MFRMNEKTKELLRGGSLNKRELAAAKRQLVYKYILEHPDASSNTELASAAGYDMNVLASNEYLAGSNFISRMIRDGYIQKETSRGMTCFYIGTKEPVSPEAEAVNEAKKVLAQEIDEYEEDQMGPEGQTKEDWATDDPIDDFPGYTDATKLLSGSIKIHSACSDGVSFTIDFRGKTRQEIIDIINNINTEFLL